MRVTEGSRYADVQRNLAKVSSQQADAANEASSGIRVNKPSDDPIAAAELARLAASQDRTEAHLKTIDTVRGDATLTESTLSDASDIFVRLKEIAIEASNGGLSADDRTSMNVEVVGLKNALLSLGNAQGTRGYLFSGSKVDSAAFDSNGVFQGDDQAHVVPIGNSTPTAVSTSGVEAFVVPGGRNVFADIDTLSTALAANDVSGVQSSLTGVEASRAQLVNARARSGLVLSKLDASESVLTSLDTEQKKRASEAGAADPFESYSRATTLNQSLERAIAVSKQILDIGATNRF
jgi:flagellar hook-associated protein 3 FlgL